MPIAGKKIAIGLTKATPTPLTTAGLKAQLTNIGLTCNQSVEELLAQYIADVKSKIPDPANGLEAWSIMQPGAASTATSEDIADMPMYESALGLQQASTGSWRPNPTALGYGPYLEYIQYADHFAWLQANRPSFTGTRNTPPAYSGTDMTVTAIKEQFEKVAVDASSVLVNGLAQSAIESALSNAVAPLQDSNATDYNPGEQSRVFFLVENFDPSTNEADGIGVLTVDWTLEVKNYKKKKHHVPERHDYNLQVDARAVIYGSIAEMKADYHAAMSHFGTADVAYGKISPVPTKVHVFDQRPPATIDAFNAGVPLTADATEAKVLVLYSPDLQSLGSADNTASSVTSTYSKAVTRGFTFTMSQTLTVTASVEVTVEVVKAGLSVSLSLGFSEQWSKQETETMSFTVPSGAIAFLYQGTLLSSVLTYDAKSGRYDYGETGRVLSPVLLTSDKPLEGKSVINRT